MAVAIMTTRRSPVPLLMAVTIFSACTIASGYALTTISLPRVRGRCVVCGAGVTGSPTLEIDVEAGPGGCQLRRHAHAHIRVAVLVADQLSGRSLPSKMIPLSKPTAAISLSESCACRSIRGSVAAPRRQQASPRP
jgi:hypothetical protein